MPKNLYDVLINIQNLLQKDLVEIDQDLEADETIESVFYDLLLEVKYAFAEDRTLNLVAELCDLLIEYGVETRIIELMLDNHNLRHTMCPDGECFPEYEDSDDDDGGEAYDYSLFDDDYDPLDEFENVISMTIKKGEDE
jgi:hypothetical protein